MTTPYNPTPQPRDIQQQLFGNIKNSPVLNQPFGNNSLNLNSAIQSGGLTYDSQNTPAVQTNPAVRTVVTAPTSNAPVNPNPGIVSSTQARTALTQGGNTLDTITNTPDPYLEYLQKKALDLQNNPSQPGIDEKNAEFEAGRQKTALEDKYQNYKAGLETLGIQSGLSRYAPGLEADKLINADKANADAIQTIQDKEDLAIAKAKQARIDGDAKTLKDTLDEIRQIKKDKSDELQSQLNKRTQDITVANSLSTQAYQDLQSLPEDQKEDYIKALAAQNNIDPGTLMASLAKEKDTQEKFNLTTALQQAQLAREGTGGTSDYSKTQLIKLRAAGIDPSEDPDLADALISGELKSATGKQGAVLTLTPKIAKKADSLGFNVDQYGVTVQQLLSQGHPIEYIGYSLGLSPEAIQYLKDNIK